MHEGELDSAVASVENEVKTARQEGTVVKTAEKKPDASPSAEELTKSLETQAGELAIAKAYGDLNDSAKAHYNTLGDDAKAEFLKMDEDGRTKALEEIQKADSLVYTSDDGTEFRKSDDPRLVKMAKQGDADRKAFKKQQDENDGLRLAKRAGEELGNMPGDEPVKVALLKAVDSIEDEDTCTKVSEILKAGNDAAAGAFVKIGTPEAPAGGKGAAGDKFDVLVKAYQAENEGVSEADAIDAVARTDAGEALYKETL